MKQIKQNTLLPIQRRWRRNIAFSVMGACGFIVNASVIAAPVDNGVGAKAIVNATQLRYITAPSGNTSGFLLPTQPVVGAVDIFNNIDTDYSRTITISETSSGVLSGILAKTALSGVASFTNLVYTATSDHESFVLKASDGTFTAINSTSLDSDVVATKLVFTTQPSPLTLTTNTNTAFTTVPVVQAQNANAIVDSDFNETITLSENGTGEGVFTLNSATATAGIATFTGLTLNHNKAETLQLVANDVDATGSDLPVATSADIVVSTAYTASIAKTTDGAENNGGTPTDAVFTVTVSPTNTSGSAITGDIAYSGTATNGTDYATGAATFSIPNNSATATITLDVSEDALAEATETIIATLSNVSTGSITTASATANLTDDDTAPVITEGDTISVSVGTDHQAITPHWGAEIAYVDLGDIDFTPQLTLPVGKTNAQAAQDVVDSLPLRGRGFTVKGTRQFALGKQWSLQLNAGLFVLKDELEATVGTSRIQEDETEYGVVAGLATSYPLSQQTKLVLDWDHYYQQRNDSDVISLGVRYWF